MERIVQIQAPLPHIKSVNIWLLRGDPVTLIDTGPRTDEALVALEAGLQLEGLRLEDIELVIPTHHHLDHSGLIATIVARSGARVAALDRAAEYGTRYVERSAADRSFSVELMRHHGVPESVIEANEGFWDFIRDTSEAFETDLVLSDGDVVTAGGRELRILARPGHSTTDALLVDEASATAFVGDHLLAGISSNAEIVPVTEPTGSRPRARVEYLGNLRRTASMPLDRLLTGHGDAVKDHKALVRRRLSEHRRRCQRILAVLEQGPEHAYGIARDLWSARTVAEQPLLVVWEVLGHLDLLLDEGRVSEQKFDDGSHYGKAWFSLPGLAERADQVGVPVSGPRETFTLYRGVDRSAEFE
ncbi:MAG TPA: MBL fold metallo-hydrolase [Solirubrobacteraceae bacterium]|nr:MBL fold metallo-hydrolase [Solirubrobacteraceae bacterium]